VTDVPGVDAETAERLADGGITSVRSLATADPEHVADSLGLDLEEGVYAAMSGPSYETPAEVEMLRTMGADAAGMSTVPECIVANQEGMDVLGVSSITNHAAGITGEPLNHAEVLEVTEDVQDDLVGLVLGLLDRIGGTACGDT